jgi:hypothetical protein
MMNKTNSMPLALKPRRGASIPKADRRTGLLGRASSKAGHDSRPRERRLFLVVEDGCRTWAMWRRGRGARQAVRT